MIYTLYINAHLFSRVLFYFFQILTFAQKQSIFLKKVGVRSDLICVIIKKKGGEDMKIKKIKNQIIRGMLTPLKLDKVDAVAFHHMAHPTWTVNDVEVYHVMKNGWLAIGYNYWIGFNGTVYEGRGLNIAAGIAGHNSHVISVGLQGDFSVQTPTDAQYKSCAELYKYLKAKIPSIQKYARHCDYNATACPGKNFDINKVAEFLNNSAKKEETKMEEKIYNWTTACPDWAKEYVHKALEKGILKGLPDGSLNLNEDKLWTIVIVMRALQGGE